MKRVDPVTFEVIRHKLNAITAEQAITQKNVSGSPIVTEACDFNNGLYLSDGSAVAMGRNILHHSATIGSLLRSVIADCEEDPGIYDGDQFIVNDPYKGALHPSDVAIVAPIFYEGERVAWAGAMAHQMDIGGMVLGSYSALATDRQQESMTIPPVKLVEREKLRKDVWNMIMAGSRLPHLLGLDLKAMIASNNVARMRLIHLINRYGIQTVKADMEGLIEMSEKKMRERLRELPDGIFRGIDFLDHDGHENVLLETRLTMTKEGDSLTFDFTGSSPQAKGGVNCTEGGLRSGVLTGMLPLLAFDIPWNEGILKPIKIICPEGLVCNAQYPAPVGLASTEETWIIQNLSTSLVSKLLACSDKYRKYAEAVTQGGVQAMTIGGLNQYGEPFGTLLLDAIAGGGGAFSYRDGLEGYGAYCVVTPNIANVETNEAFAPVLYLHRRIFPDTGGPGKFRGGATAGLAFTPHDTDSLKATIVSHGIDVPNSAGQFGGLPGACGVNWLFKNTDLFEKMKEGQIPFTAKELDGEMHDIGAKDVGIVIFPGDVWEFIFLGGGGYGDPLDREPRSVQRDVINGLVSTPWAEKVYGVLINPENMELDLDETKKLREKKIEERLEKARSYAASDRSPLLEAKSGKRIGQIGEYMYIIDSLGKKFFRCLCGYDFCPINKNWKEEACQIFLLPTDIGPRIKVRDELELRGYLCPKCGILHSTEVARKGEPPLWNIEIKF